MDGIDTVVHFAAAVGVGQSMYEIERYTSINAIGAAVVLEEIAERRDQLGRRARRLVHVDLRRGPLPLPAARPGRTASATATSSSTAASGSSCCDECGAALEPLPTAETKPSAPTSIYADRQARPRGDVPRHRRAPTGCRRSRCASSTSTATARRSPTRTPASRRSSPARLLNGNAPLVFEDGLQSRDFIHVSDIAARLHHWRSRPAAPTAAPLNVGTGVPTSVLDVAHELARGLGKDIQPEIVNKFRAGDIRHCSPTSRWPRELLGFEPKMPFDAGMRELLGWLATQQADGPVDAAREAARGRGLDAVSSSPTSRSPSSTTTTASCCWPASSRWRARRRASRCRSIVIDNASTDGTADAVPRALPGRRGGRARRSAHGFGANHNEAIRRSTGRYVLILNEDTVLHPGSLTAMCRFMDQNPGVGAAGPRILYPDGRDQPSAFHFPSPARVALTTLTLQRAFWIQSRGERSGKVDWVCGAAILARRDRAGGDRRLRRAAVHLLRGPRPVPAAARRRLRDRLLPARVARALRERDHQRRARAADLPDGAQPGDLHPQAPRRRRRVRGAGDDRGRVRHPGGRRQGAADRPRREPGQAARSVRARHSS